MKLKWSGRRIADFNGREMWGDNNTYTHTMMAIATVERDYNGDVTETFGFYESYESTGDSSLVNRFRSRIR